MKRFYFETHHGDQVFDDEIGQELADPQAAKQIAIAMLPDVSVPLACGQIRSEVAVHVRDEDGERVLTARLCLSIEWAGH